MASATRYSICFKALKNGQHRFDFAFDGKLFSQFENSEIRDAAGTIEVLLNKAGERLLDADVVIRGEVTVPCDRCLENCAVPVDYEGRVAVKFCEEECPESDGEILWLPASESVLDLTQYVYESILLSLPYQRVHPEGECDPAMTRHFKIVSGEEFERLESEIGREEPQEDEAWSKLAELRERMDGSQEDK